MTLTFPPPSSFYLFFSIYGFFKDYLKFYVYCRFKLEILFSFILFLGGEHD